MRLSRAEPVAEEEWPRLLNLATGLAHRAGSPVPELWVTSEGGRNAFVSRTRGRDRVAVSRELLEMGSRTELEAVLAHCVGRLRGGRLAAEALVSAWGWLPLCPPIVGTGDDVRAAELTRYPPALATALSAAGPPGPLPAFWFAADAPTHESRARRLALLADL
jgi:hypothetical protein